MLEASFFPNLGPFWRVLLRRLAAALVLLFWVPILCFVLAEAAPGDYLAELRADPRLGEETLSQLRQRYGLDLSLGARYGAWLASVGRGELGFSFSHNMPLAPLLAPRLAQSLLLAGFATSLAWVLALVAGLVVGSHQGTWLDRATTLASAALAALPELVLAFLLLLWASQTGFFPLGGNASLETPSSTWGRWLDHLHHLALPSLTLIVGQFPGLLRTVRMATRVALEDPVHPASLAHGLPLARRVRSYLLPSLAPSLLPLAGISLGQLLSASLLVEVIFGWPGLGPLFLEAVFARDLHVVIAVLLLSAFLLLVGNLAADLAALALDPRQREI